MFERYTNIPEVISQVDKRSLGLMLFGLIEGALLISGHEGGTGVVREFIETGTLDPRLITSLASELRQAREAGALILSGTGLITWTAR